MYKNNEGYPDPTEGEAICNADKMPEDCKRTIRMMLSVASCMGYHVESKIVLKDVKTGHVWP